MKKKLLTAIVIFAIIVVSALTVGYSLNNKQKDTSWLGSATQILGNYSLYPNGTDQNNPAILASYCRAYLYENGSSGLVEFGNLNSNQTLSIYLDNLLAKANYKLNPISTDSLNKILTSDKILEIVYRGSTQQFGGQQKFSVGYFILVDNLNEGLTGTFITQEVGSQNLNVWEIAK